MIWIIDSQHWPRACIRAELIERGYEAEGFEYLPDALAALSRKKTQKPDLILLELREQSIGPADLDKLRDSGIPVIAIGGAEEWNNPIFGEFPWKTRFRRPFSIGELCEGVIREMGGYSGIRR